MRSYEIVRELSYDSFIETYGRVPAEASSTDKTNSVSKRHSMFVRPKDVIGVKAFGRRTVTKDTEEQFNCDNADNNNNAIQQESTSGVSSDSPSNAEIKSKMASPVYRRLRKISLRKKDSKFDGEKMKIPSIKRSRSISRVNATSTKSSFRQSNWLSTLSPNFYRKSAKEVSDAKCVQVPLSKINFAVYRGFLSKRNEKKQEWERFWCVFQDTCLYCYSSPESEFAEDVIALCGASIKVGQTNCTTTVVLQTSKTESHQFKADSQNQQNAWLAALNKHVRGKVCEKQTNPSKKITRSVSAVNSYSCKREKSSKTIQRSSSDQQMNVSNAKAKLLRELLAQREQILREQKILERLTVSKQKATCCSPAVVHKHGKTPSVSSLTQSEDVGYCSSLDGSMHDALSEYEEPRSELPPVRPNRSLSFISAVSTLSLCSIAEEKRKSDDVCPRILAEIEEFRAFSKRTLLERANSN